MRTATATATRPHGELDCDDAEALLHDTTAHTESLRSQLAIAQQAHDDGLRQIELMRVEAERLRALLHDVSNKNSTLADERDGLKDQVNMLHEELAATEQDVVPEGTIIFGAVSRDHMVSEYRRISRVTRGPLPPSVIRAVENSATEVTEAMKTVGAQAITTIIQREVRRRRRAQNRRTPTR